MVIFSTKLNRKLTLFVLGGGVLCLFLTSDLWGPKVSKQIGKISEPLQTRFDESAICSELGSVEFPTAQPVSTKLTTGSFEMAKKPIGRLLPAIASSVKTRRVGSDYCETRDTLLWIDLDTLETSSAVFADRWFKFIHTDDSSALLLSDQGLKVFKKGGLTPVCDWNRETNDVINMIPLSANRVILDKGNRGAEILDWTEKKVLAEFGRDTVCPESNPNNLLFMEDKTEADKIWYLQKTCRHETTESRVILGYYDLTGKKRKLLLTEEMAETPVAMSNTESTVEIICADGGVLFKYQIPKDAAENLALNKNRMPVTQSDMVTVSYFVNELNRQTEKGEVWSIDTDSGTTRILVQGDFINGDCANIQRSVLNDVEKSSVYVGFINGWISRFDIPDMAVVW